MNKNKSSKALPCFVEIIKQLTADEAKLLSFFKHNHTLPIVNFGLRTNGNGTKFFMKKFTDLDKNVSCEQKKLITSYLDNLERLGLIAIDFSHWFTDDKKYQHLLDNPYVTMFDDQFVKNKPDKSLAVDKGILSLTDLGKLFTDICIQEAQPIIVKPKQPE
ncbi:hypothetical protein GCM10023211_12940 [Orbus sasakiae]|uniref:Uncharacterized protein n=1 Tax=Orbus sasakiae TaxID=1078475 RepID=A0ABP9N4D7_9GAMM